MLSFSSTADAQKQTIRVILRFSWHHHFMSFKTHVFSFTQSPHRSLSSLEQNPGKDDQRQRGPHPTGVCWCQMNFQEHRVMHVDGHPILEIFWRMIQTWQQVTNITMRKIPGKPIGKKRSHKYLNTPGDSKTGILCPDDPSIWRSSPKFGQFSENYQFFDPGCGETPSLPLYINPSVIQQRYPLTKELEMTDFVQPKKPGNDDHLSIIIIYSIKSNTKTQTT